jgi:hypothetical protein
LVETETIDRDKRGGVFTASDMPCSATPAAGVRIDLQDDRELWWNCGGSSAATSKAHGALNPAFPMHSGPCISKRRWRSDCFCCTQLRQQPASLIFCQ